MIQAQLTEKIDSLVLGNQNLQDKLKPFENLANKMYPGIETDAALGRLSREVQQVREATTQLNERTAPRRLDDDRRQRIIASIQQHPSQSISLTTVMGDTEAFQFATDLKSALEAGGWKVDGVSQGVFTSPIKGVLIKVGVNPPPQQAEWLFEALKSGGGIHSSGALNKQTLPDKCELLIGSKE